MIIKPGYDVAITGGGLAGLSLAIQCARAGYSTALFEKEKYPFHKVCGEYISFENWNYLQDLGIPLSDMNLPMINRLLISSPDGRSIESQLPLGGFGISRYLIDNLLFQIASKEGVTVFQQTKVNDIIYKSDCFEITSSKGTFTCRIAAGSFGKRSNIDIRWKRKFAQHNHGKLSDFIGIKYHIRYASETDLIALHNFENGYCGISKIEDDKSCLCYLTRGVNLRASVNDIKQMEKTILMKNPFLKDIFLNAEFLFDKPVTISRISFERKSQVENHVLLIGDAAGLIAPLCGNGMSMALHAAKLAFNEINLYQKGMIDRYEMEKHYEQEWEKHFAKRLVAGRMIQGFFGNPAMSNLLLRSVKPFPRLIRKLIRQTHGTPY
ncbi:MAG: NAD(P)/FAD-dependent oxidoreductase [Chitinophagaceae bacterium]|nr:MAG: NAD(P)/FAD-dependent oxidoreductase [Chitinophagaceae bacterium]